MGLCNGDGETVTTPTERDVRRILGGLGRWDIDHGFAILEDEAGNSLEYDAVQRLLQLGDPTGSSAYLTGVTRERAIEVFLLLQRGEVAKLKALWWSPGPPPAPEGWLVSWVERVHAWRIAADDAGFTQGLGPESGEVCRTESCSRRSVRFSVFCRQHHFERERKRPFPPGR